MMILAFHCATTGLIQYKDGAGNSIRSNHPSQPHIVRLAAVLHNTETREDEQTLDFVVKPDGWKIEQGAINVHGITNEAALGAGIGEKDILELFMGMWKSCDIRTGHSVSFHNRIIRIGLKRYLPDLVEDEVWKDKKQYFCTMTNSKGAASKKLADVYQHYTGNYFKLAGNTMGEASASLEIYLKMVGR